MIFVDTSFWIASMIRQDRYHAEALTLLDQIAPEQLVTTNHIRGETWTFLRRRAGHRAAVGFFDHLDRSSRLQIIHVEAELERRAVEWLRRHDERGYSFVDATCFAVMRSLKIRRALAFDGDFIAAGFVELRPS